MEEKISLLRQIYLRLGLKSPKLFRALQITFYVVGALFAGLVVYNQLIPTTQVDEVLKILGIAGTVGSAIGIFLSKLPVADEQELKEKIEEVVIKKEQKELLEK